MHSIRTKIIVLTACAIIVATAVATVLASISIRDLGNDSSNQILYLMCETGKKNLDSYFDSIMQSVETVYSFAEEDLKTTETGELGEHLDKVKSVFEKTAKNTVGVLTYYYRIDPEFSSDEIGFWFVDLNGEGFKENNPTDINLYDTDNISELVWFTVPKYNGTSIWLSPYYTDTINIYVFSYNVPVYYTDGKFLGVIGMEIDYDTIVDQTKNITLYDNGYAFINDSFGNIIYHPHYDIKSMTEETKPTVPVGLLSESSFITYKFEGVEKQAVWMELDNGMRLNVTVPTNEINANWYNLIKYAVAIAALLLVIFIALTFQLAEHITAPLRDLTAAALQVNEGNYDFELTYNGNDEVGILTHTFNKLTSHLKDYISDLNDLAYGDALTSVHNKGAFDIYVREIQNRINDTKGQLEFAVGIFDCDDLKSVNDRYGHEKGDIYLQTASSLICRVFNHSPVFRIGGDEFATILQNEDYRNKDELTAKFERKSNEIRAKSDGIWHQVSVAIGIASFDPNIDTTVTDVIRRADELMYENKRSKKAIRTEENAPT